MINFFRSFIDVVGRKYKFRLFIVFFLSIFAGLIEVLGIALIFPFITIVSKPEIIETNQYLKTLYDFFDFSDKKSIIYAMAILIGSAFLIKNFYMIFYQNLQLNLIKNWRNDICKFMVGRYLHAPYGYHLKKSSPHMINMMSHTVTFVLHSFVFSLMSLFSNLIVTVMLMGFILTQFFIASMISGVILLIMTLIQSWIIRRQTAIINKEYNITHTQNLGVLSQSLAAIKETKTFVREKYFQSLYEDSNQVISQQNKSMQFVQILPMYVNEIILVIAIILMACLVLMEGDNVIIDIANLAVLAAVAFRLAPMINRSLYSYSQVKVSTISAKELMDEYQELSNLAIEDSIDTPRPLHFQNSIKLKNISFQYSELESSVLDNINFEIKKGDFIGIVGASGAGKTTLVDITLGLLKPTSGEFYIDDALIQTNNIQRLRLLMGYVSQNPYIATGTVKNNVAFGLKETEIDNDRVIHALTMSRLNDFFSQKPDYLSTVITENGKSLSGGQRQRLAIARALYNNPEVIILDEATSALDVETEFEITQVINGLKGNKTIIAIAHRLSTLRECNKIVYMDKGRIIDSGSFSELSAKYQNFARLLELSDPISKS